MNVTIGSGRASRIAIAFLLIATTVAGCSTAPIVGAASAAPQALAEMRTEADATRSVCFDFEAHGGALYQMFVVPMLTSKRPGYQSVTVDVVQMRRATDSLTQMTKANFEKASDAVRDPAERTVAAAMSLGLYDHSEGTALLTAFTERAVECTKAQHKPSWFEPAALAGQ